MNQPNKEKQNLEVTGFTAGAVASGLKKNGRPDLALIVSEKAAAAAAVFTANKVKAAPVILSRRHIQNGTAQAIVANAGNANACTGAPGLADAEQTAQMVASELGIPAADVLVASTGVIGQRLNMEKVAAALPNLKKVLSRDGIPRAAEAIMTTDSFPKTAVFNGMAGGIPYRIAGLCKGAGMIMPDMATMLCFLLTDIFIDAETLQQMLQRATVKTFNRITVDGDTSTNDTAMVLANGMAGNGELSDPEFSAFEKGLTGIMGQLARMMVEDGEGASKLVDVIVKNAFSPEDAFKAARTVANSSLVKTAFYGQDPNWGRILAALGRAGITMDETRVDLWINDVNIVTGGLGNGIELERQAAKLMTEETFTLTIDLHQGRYKDQIVTCDLTHEYVSINADYRT